ncbi:TPA: DDE-type integrase/transposase/recombinase [Legionella anisa]
MLQHWNESIIYYLFPLFIEVRRIKYLNNMVEQDHRGIKNITKYKLGFKSFQAAKQKLQELNYIE